MLAYFVKAQAEELRKCFEDFDPEKKGDLEALRGSFG